MTGDLTVIRTDGTIETIGLSKPPSLELMQEHVGGYIELIPHFKRYEGKPCVAFCDEDGRRKQLPPNAAATKLWAAQCAWSVEWLVGNVAIITGDRALMSKL